MIEDPVYGPLERASKVIEERLTRDERWFGVGETLTGQFERELACRWRRGGVRRQLDAVEWRKGSELGNCVENGGRCFSNALRATPGLGSAGWV